MAKHTKKKNPDDDIVYTNPDAIVPPPNIPAPLAKPLLEIWADAGIACDFVRFSQEAVQPGHQKEPMWEFRTETTSPRYQVNAIIYTPHGVLFSAHGRMRIVPLANVAYVQPV